MRNIRKLGLVDYFRKVIEYNTPKFIAPYNHQSLFQWTEAEISEAKKLALTDWLIEKIKSNPDHKIKGTKYPHSILLRAGWTEVQIKDAIKAAQPSRLKMLVWAVFLAVAAGLIYYSYVLNAK